MWTIYKSIFHSNGQMIRLKPSTIATTVYRDTLMYHLLPKHIMIPEETSHC